jgi:hypothetical protein
MDNHFPASQAKSLRSLYQDLHAIVAQAGYLSIGIRWSTNIFRFSSPFPGQAWDLDQQHVDDAPYNASLAASHMADKMAEAKWNAHAERIRLERQAAAVTPQTAPTRGQAFLVPALNKIKTIRGKNKKTTPNSSIWHRPSRLAKVQIIIWPMLQRFATVGEIDPETGAANGETITTVLKAQVVYYSGRVDQTGEQSEDHPTLEEWVYEKKQARIWEFVRPFRWVVYAASVLVLLNLLAPYSKLVYDFVQMIRYALLGVAKYIIREALLLVIEAVIIFISILVLLARAVTFFGFVMRYSIVSFIGLGRGILSGDWASFRDGLRVGWNSLVFQWPRLGFGWVRNVAKDMLGKIEWKTLSIDIPTGFGGV